MTRCLAVAALALLALAAPLSAAGITGQYIEARTCDVWTGACFANAEMNLSGRNAVLGWKVEKGALDGVTLDGLGVVAVVQASDTLGLEQTGPAKAILIVDSRASEAQRSALIRLARQQGGELLRNVIAVETAPIELTRCPCKNDVCAKLDAGTARIETRCLDANHDKACGHESDFYPPLAKNVKVRAAMATEHAFTGKAFNATWKEAERRGAYVGSFEIR
ncbi:MAG TPA: DUF1326 domain-containing protein [Gemmataceae bacterium]|jgi:hypothetical protein|nr:DUF1326 domain-containing protein [Gemmataceae bacterium]